MEQAVPSKLELNVVPNPSSTSFNLKVSSPSLQAGTVRVYDALGKMVEARNVSFPSPGISIGYFYRPGVYYIELIQGNERRTAKMVKLSN